MPELRRRQVDWTAEYEDWESVCPFCHGEGERPIETAYYFCDNEDCDNYEAEQEGPGPCATCREELHEEIDVSDYDWCEYCEGHGYIDPMWNTVWDVGYAGYGAISERQQREVLENTNCAVLWNYEDNAWYLCLMACGMNLTASLAKALAILGFSWLPESWAYKMARDMDYATYVAGEDAMPQLKDMMANTAQQMRREAGVIMEAVEAYEEGLAAGVIE